MNKIYFLVYVKCPIEVCEQRDTKGMYAKARTGEIKQFTGIDSPFEEPDKADIVVKTDKQKIEVALARTLLLERDILFLDEPTLGLDVKTVNLFIDIIKNVESTIIFTSHDLSVVEKLCDRIAFIKEGKIIKIMTQDEIKNLAGPGITVEIFINNKKQDLIDQLQDLNFEIEYDEKKNSILVFLYERTHYKNLFDLLRNYEILKIKEIETSLEDFFLKKY